MFTEEAEKPADLTERVIFKSKPKKQPEIDNLASSSKEKEQKKKVKKEEKKAASKSKLSFNDDEEEEGE